MYSLSPITNLPPNEELAISAPRPCTTTSSRVVFMTSHACGITVSYTNPAISLVYREDGCSSTTICSNSSKIAVGGKKGGREADAG